MIRSLLFVVDPSTDSQRALRHLEDLLERVDPVVEVLALTGTANTLQPILERLEALDVRVGRCEVRHGDLVTELTHWVSEGTVPSLIVMEGTPDQTLLRTLPAPLLLLPKSDDPMPMREAVVACSSALAAAATVLAALCRSRSAGVVLVLEGPSTPEQERARTRLEAVGASTLIRRRAAELDSGAFLAEFEDSDLAVVEAPRATASLFAALLTRRAVLVLPTTRRALTAA